MRRSRSRIIMRVMMNVFHFTNTHHYIPIITRAMTDESSRRGPSLVDVNDHCLVLIMSHLSSEDLNTFAFCSHRDIVKLAATHPSTRHARVQSLFQRLQLFTLCSIQLKNAVGMQSYPGTELI